MHLLSRLAYTKTSKVDMHTSAERPSSSRCGVQQVIDAVKRVTGKDFPVSEEGRRAGDPAQLVAKADAAREVLNWEPKSSDLESIVRTAWEWHSARPNGYAD